jgi:hypothetical protein
MNRGSSKLLIATIDRQLRMVLYPWITEVVDDPGFWGPKPMTTKDRQTFLDESKNLIREYILVHYPGYPEWQTLGIAALALVWRYLYGSPEPNESKLRDLCAGECPEERYDEIADELYRLWHMRKKHSSSVGHPSAHVSAPSSHGNPEAVTPSAAAAAAAPAGGTTAVRVGVGEASV